MISGVVVTWVGKVGVMSCIAITVGWGLSLQSLLRRRRLRSGDNSEVLRLGKLEKMKSHISNIDDDQEVGGGGGGGGGTYVQSIKWGCPSFAVPEFEKFPVPQFMWSGPSCTQSWMHDLQPRARGWELELGIFQRKPRPKVKSRDPPLPQSNYEKNSRHYYRVGITVLRCHDLECVSPVVGSTVEAGRRRYLVHSLQVLGLTGYDMYLIG